MEGSRIIDFTCNNEAINNPSVSALADHLLENFHKLKEILESEEDKYVLDYLNKIWNNEV